MPVNSSGKLRILHLIDSCGLYGAEKVLLGIASGSTQLGHTVVIGTMVSPEDRSDALGEAATTRGIEHVQFRMSDGFNIAGLREIVGFAGREAIDVIHTHGYRPNIMLGILPRAMRPCPVITTMHGWTDGPWYKTPGRYEILERLLARRLDAVAIVSETMRRRLPRGIREEKIQCIPNGIDLDAFGASEFPSESESNSGFGSAEELTVLSIGRLSHEKGFDVLLRAVAELHKSDLTIRLIIAGSGPENDGLKSLARDLEISDSVDFPGYVEDVRRLYARADILVIPSRTEGLPMVLLEAMVAGVPVIGTRVGQMPAVLKDGDLGVLIEPESIEDLAEAIKELTSRPDETRIRTREARSHVIENYSSVSMTRRYKDMYESVLQ